MKPSCLSLPCWHKQSYTPRLGFVSLFDSIRSMHTVCGSEDPPCASLMFIFSPSQRSAAREKDDVDLEATQVMGILHLQTESARWVNRAVVITPVGTRSPSLLSS